MKQIWATCRAVYETKIFFGLIILLGIASLSVNLVPALEPIRKWSLAGTILAAAATMVLRLFSYAHSLRIQINDGRTKLSELRKQGVALRNEGEILHNRDTLGEWLLRVEKWNEGVLEAIGKISVADKIWFETLDIVPEPRVQPHLSDDIAFMKGYRHLDFRLARLDEMIRDLWGRK